MSAKTLFLIAMFAAVPLWATAQAPDLIKVDGSTYDLLTNPLTPFLVEHAGCLPETDIISTGNYRGYIAMWAIRGGKLFVEDVTVPASDRDLPAMRALFGDEAPRAATWFSGHLIIATGELVEYVHLGYGSTYGSYIVATVIEGQVRERRTLSRAEFEAFRRAQFEAFRKTPEYRAEVEAVNGKGAVDKQTEMFFFAVAAEEYLSRIFP